MSRTGLWGGSLYSSLFWLTSLTLYSELVEGGSGTPLTSLLFLGSEYRVRLVSQNKELYK